MEFEQSTGNQKKLHMGAFNCPVDGWINTDITPHIWIARIPGAAALLYAAKKMTKERYQEHKQGVFRRLTYLDLTKPLPFANETITAAFSSHVMEHLFSDEVERLVRELHRVLVPGGVCRVVVPGLEQIVSIFDPADPSEFIKKIFEVGKRGDIKNAHHCGFTNESLKSLFLKAGFSQAYACEYRQGKCPDLEKLDNRPKESIYVEAIK